MPIPTAPSNLTASNGSGNDINLAWQDNSSDETGFKIERKLGTSGSYAQIDTVGDGVTSYADTSSKTANRPYIYRVRATNASGDSAYTNEADAVTPFTGTVPNYKTDAANYAETPTTMPLPLAGGKFYDETFGTLVMRFTDESDGVGFSTNYSVWPTLNCDNTKVFLFNLVNNNYWIGTLNPATFERVGSLQSVATAPASIFAHYEAAFWSFLDPDKLFITVDAKIYFYRPSTNAYTLVKSLTSSFPAGYYFNQLYVSSDDNRFAALLKSSSGDQGFMVWEQSTDTLKLDVRTTDVNGITMDKTGDYVLLVPNTPFADQPIYNVDTGSFDSLVSNPSTGLPDFQIGHNDTGADLIASDDQWNGGISVRRMSTPHDIDLAWQYAPYWFSHHVSLRADNDDWGLVSTYGDSAVSADSAKYRRELIQVGLQAGVLGQIRRVAHTRSNWQANIQRTVTGATNASPIVVSLSANHNMTTGMRVQISGVLGNTAANGFFYLTVVDSTRISLDGSTGNGAYTSGGQAFIDTYWDTPRANVSRDGQFIAFTSNWNGIAGGGRLDLFIAQIEPTADPSASSSPSASASPSPSRSPSASPSSSRSASPSSTPSASVSSSPSSSQSPSASPSSSRSASRSASPSASRSLSPSLSPSSSPSPSASPSASPSGSASASPSSSRSASPSASPSSSPSASPSGSPSASPSPSSSPSSSPSLSQSPSSSVSASPSSSPSPSSSLSASPSSSPSPSGSPSFSPSASPSASPSVTPSSSPSSSPSGSISLPETYQKVITGYFAMQREVVGKFSMRQDLSGIL